MSQVNSVKITSTFSSTRFAQRTMREEKERRHEIKGYLYDRTKLMMNVRMALWLIQRCDCAGDFVNTVLFDIALVQLLRE